MKSILPFLRKIIFLVTEALPTIGVKIPGRMIGFVAAIDLLAWTTEEDDAVVIVLRELTESAAGVDRLLGDVHRRGDHRTETESEIGTEMADHLTDGTGEDCHRIEEDTLEMVHRCTGDVADPGLPITAGSEVLK